MPAFDSGITEYTAETTNATNTITATPIDSAATIFIAVNGDVVANGTAATWSDGENVVTITVTNGGKTQIYTVTVTKT
ncbi:MAG: cadherin-like beta sandwich domain-containing protein [Enterococcus lemanii]